VTAASSRESQSLSGAARAGTAAPSPYGLRSFSRAAIRLHHGFAEPLVDFAAGPATSASVKRITSPTRG